MNVLQLTNRVPYPLHDGGNLAVYNLTEGLLKENVALSLLSMNTSRHFVDTATLPDTFRKLALFETIDVDNSLKPIGALKSLLSGTSYNLQRFISQEFAQRLKAILQQNNYDIVLLEGLYVVPYIPVIRKYSTAKIVYRQHNVEFQIWERHAEATQNVLKKWYLKQLAAALKKFELRHLNDYDLMVPISAVDGDYYQKLGAEVPMLVLPFSISPNNIPFQPALDAPFQLYHIGAMDWKPNAEGILWFLNKVWPKVLAVLPSATLSLAGRNMPENFKNGNWPNVQIVGEVPDALAYEKDKSILIVPLLSGGGIRVKILQAMAMGKPVVTTPVGLQGIVEAEEGKHILIGDTAESFATKTLLLLNNPEMAKKMSEAASNLIRSHYNSALLMPKLVKAFEDLLK